MILKYVAVSIHLPFNTMRTIHQGLTSLSLFYLIHCNRFWILFGDFFQDLSFSSLEIRGIFVKEVEKTDVAVSSVRRLSVIIIRDENATLRYAKPRLLNRKCILGKIASQYPILAEAKELSYQENHLESAAIRRRTN